MLNELEAESIACEESWIEVCHDSVLYTVFLGPSHHSGSEVNDIPEYGEFLTPLFWTNYASKGLAWRYTNVAANIMEAWQLFSDPEPCIYGSFRIIRASHWRNAPQHN